MARVIKRPTPATESEDEDDHATSSPAKRIKTSRSTGDLPTPVTDGEGSEDGSVVQLEGDEEYSDEDDDEDGDADAEDEREDLEAFKAAKEMQKKLGYNSTGADAGAIKQVLLHEFMCHKNLRVDFSQRMNFLVGHNGSGKSAILTAISIALGGKAALTGRGGSVKDLIRQGSDKAVITLTLSNKGCEAYKPEIFNPDIVIERTITKTSSGYKIRASKDGKIISTKKDEVTQICSAFHLQVDSPLTVLTQDAARSFLQTADDAKLYKFFLNGTGLQALFEGYEQLQRSVKSLEGIVSRSQAGLPDLKARVDGLQRKIDAGTKIMDQKRRKNEVEVELAWSFVYGKEVERDECRTKVNEFAAKVEEIETRFQQSERALEPLDAQIKHLHQETQEYDSLRGLIDDAYRQAKGRLSGAKMALADFNVEVESLRAKVDSDEKELQKLDARIADKRLALNSGKSAEQIKDDERLEHLDRLRRRCDAEIPIKEELIVRLTKDCEKVQLEKDDLDRQTAAAANTIRQTEGDLRNWERQTQNRLSAFGNRIELVMDAINRAQWHHKPVGPLGLYVQLEDMAYRDILHSLLGSTLCTWAIQDPRDRTKLTEIIKQAYQKGYRPASGRGEPSVITNSADIFDYSAGDLRDRGETILAKLAISDEYVTRVLINSGNIERFFLARDNVAAQREMKRLLNTGLSHVRIFTADLFDHQGTHTSRQNGPVPPWSGNLLFTQNLAADIDSLRHRLGREQEDRTRVQDMFKQAVAKKNQLEQELAQAKRDLLKLQAGLKMSLAETDSLRDKLAHDPEDEIGGFEASRRDLLETKSMTEVHLAALTPKIADRQTAVADAQREFDDAEKKRVDYQPERERKLAAMAALAAERQGAQETSKHWRRSLESKKVLKLEADRSLEALEIEVIKWAEQAEKNYSERVPVTKKAEALESERKAIVKSIEEAEKRQGISIDELSTQLANAKKKYRESQKLIGQFDALVITGNLAVAARHRWWYDTRKTCAIRARCAFLTNLDNRGFYGRLLFFHDPGRLCMQIRTGGGETQATQSQYQSVKRLSGGERSFTTVSLLLALWDTVSGPLRAMDEWDVFLDVANRSVAAKLLVDGAKDSSQKQFIFITPQDMSGVTPGATDKIIKLADPVRNQGTLV